MPIRLQREQNDLDGDGLGDICDGDMDGDGVRNDYALVFGDERYMLEFHTVGGEMVAVDPVAQRPYFNVTPEDRDGVKAGACYCAEHNLDGTWSDECTEFGIGTCRKDRDVDFATRRFIWSPINSPTLDATTGTPPDVSEAYPISTNYPDEPHPEHYDAVKDYSLFYYRGGFSFMRQHSSENFHEFDWVWPDSVDYKPPIDLWFNNADVYDADKHLDQRTVSIRVAWPSFGQNEDPYTEVAISKNERIGQSQKMSGRGIDLVTTEQLVVGAMPSIENYWFDPRGPLLPNYFMAVDPVTKALGRRTTMTAQSLDRTQHHGMYPHN